MSRISLGEKEYKPTIGLEVHIELKTETKMFCSCKNDTEETRPNINVCPICLGHPGVLPTINKKAVELVIKLGLALNGEIAKKAQFDRKSYFYPDLPKGYQISQYDNPLVKGGKLAGIGLTRIHLEEDAGRLAHAESGSLVDFNRAGLPLMELVTEPDIDSSEKAVEFAKELQLVMRYLNASNADMEKGEMRIEANISVAKDGSKNLGTKVEVKNLNSFRSVKYAIEDEIKRQIEVLKKGDKVIQETRGWDESKSITVPQRIKEESEDYRYMPEPDLPGVDFNVKDSIDIDSLKVALPELPWQKRNRFADEYKLPINSDELERLIEDREEADFFEEFVSEIKTQGGDIDAMRLGINYIDSDLVGLMAKSKIGWQEIKITPENFSELILMIYNGSVTSKVAKSVLEEMFNTGIDPSSGPSPSPSQIVEEKELGQISDESEITTTVKEIIAENTQAVLDFKKGKEVAIKFLIGQAMGRLRGRGNPELLEKLFRENLSK